MSKIFAILFTIFFIIPFLIRGIIRFVFGINKSQPRSSKSNKNDKSSQTQNPPSKKKVFSENEGEYIDYEILDD